MFDWNDEELASIIWGESKETDDHIVPHPEGNEDHQKKKEWNQETAPIKPTEEKILGLKIDFNDSKTGSSANINKKRCSDVSAFGSDSWPNLSSSNAVTNDTRTIEPRYGSFKAGLDEPDKASECSKNTHEDKEQGEFVDYGWSTIGSFEDLDRIFSNDESLYGSENLDSADELWSYSKNVTLSPIRSVSGYADSPTLRSKPLTGTGASEGVEIKAEYVQQDRSVRLAYKEMNDHASTLLQHSQILKKVEDNQSQKKLLSNQDDAVEGRSRERPLEDVSRAWYSTGDATGPHEHQLAPHIMPYDRADSSWSRQLQNPDFLQKNPVSNTYMALAVGNSVNPYPLMPLLSPNLSGECKKKSLISGYEKSSGSANHVTNVVDLPEKILSMTPQEKIEKLRRRQQLQAMLAIQKRQQQLTQHVSGHSVAEKCAQKNQVLHLGGPDGEEVADMGPVASLDPSSPLEYDYSDSMSVAVDDYSVEDNILQRLQDVITKLDSRIRLCMRDSLFRLAQSVMQRQQISETGTTKTNTRQQHKKVVEEVNACDSRQAKMGTAETETNPIDRAVSHLLFHRPLETASKHSGLAESSISTNFSSERKAAGSGNLQGIDLPDSPNSRQIIPCQGPKTPTSTRTKPRKSGQFKASENTSSDGCNDDATMEVEACY
ncbi:protein LNK2-like isoform X1 [Syzygium oleosum]|uniref:protein LNK2-like isoform X1 n=1 Tax=Syzygium oleosum TaxID=219896 RepID=UPI0011D2A268|nr:protein LNK2-like isoform X1 [Syzygium oleosum]XP_056169087.1 protein LNK2-like isoform X1 [Syzygium oleosum]XP_056169088.1 protein LNK2-like isoform X1 [Syzygium oleosum]